MDRRSGLSRRLISCSLVASTVIGALGLSQARTRANAEPRLASLTNNERVERGDGVLEVRRELTTIAREHSRAMAAAGRIFHSTQLASDVGGRLLVLGENVGSGPNVESIHSALMRSVHHRANILDTRFTQIGIGVAFQGSTVYVTEVFVTRAP